MITQIQNRYYTNRNPTYIPLNGVFAQCLRGAKPEDLLDAEWKEEEGG